MCQSLKTKIQNVNYRQINIVMGPSTQHTCIRMDAAICGLMPSWKRESLSSGLQSPSSSANTHEELAQQWTKEFRLLSLG